MHACKRTYLSTHNAASEAVTCSGPWIQDERKVRCMVSSNTYVCVSIV